MLYAIFGVLVIILDQWVKYWTQVNLAVNETKEFIPGLISLINIHNTGAAFGFLSGANAGKFFIIFALAFTVIVIIGLITNFISGKLARWSAVFVAAGGIGNAIDRLLYDYVQDMFSFDFFKSFPVFNVADIFITLFCFVFILCIIFGKDSKAEKEGRAGYYEEEPEEEIPNRRSAGRKAARNQEPEGEEEVEAPRRKSKTRIAAEEKADRKQRRSKYEDEFEQYKAARKERVTDEETVREVPSFDSSDPFAEWEKPAKKVASAQPESVRTAPVKKAAPAAEPARTAPAAEAAPVKKSSSSTDFDLDDILAEFK